MVGATMVICILSFTVWLHHFFTMGSGADVNAIFGILSSGSLSIDGPRNLVKAMAVFQFRLVVLQAFVQLCQVDCKAMLRLPSQSMFNAMPAIKRRTGSGLMAFVATSALYFTNGFVIASPVAALADIAHHTPIQGNQ